MAQTPSTPKTEDTARTTESICATLPFVGAEREGFPDGAHMRLDHRVIGHIFLLNHIAPLHATAGIPENDGVSTGHGS